MKKMSVVPIHYLDKIVSRKIPITKSGKLEYIIRKNTEYNIQYLHFLSMICGTQTEVINSMNVKHFVIVSSSIMEAVLTYELIYRNLIPKEEWDIVGIIKGEKLVCEDKYRAETVLYKKTSSIKNKECTFKEKINIAQNKYILGKNIEIYRSLSKICRLRNKVHIHIGESTDYQLFGSKLLKEVKEILFDFFKIYFKISKKEADDILGFLQNED